jgi:hypothetical protein
MAVDFFKNNVFFIDEDVAFLKFTNAYKVFGEDGDHIGNVQQKMSGSHKILSFFINKAMFPLSLDIVGKDGKALISLRRGWSFFMSKLSVLDENGAHIANINQKFKFSTFAHGKCV